MRYISKASGVVLTENIIDSTQPEDVESYALKLKAIRIQELELKLKDYDYIGTKIATGRATKEEYAEQIAQMTEWADEISRLREELKAAEEIKEEPIENSCQVVRDKV